ncbi:hypothetical protein N7532_001578 [Penicillium argentinense]|uniref:Uncharacterized protein n=1 Tax=Penicillium argentinense TaxID=1131581 RepID=A0A9W9KMK6_9EURO|nr:uncharacterized protein N7532_001578 [Penicillium argentinense]KAJ5111043.1 hypothetical protein N7532_001578 [Penicillium argentinense]
MLALCTHSFEFVYFVYPGWNSCTAAEVNRKTTPTEKEGRRVYVSEKKNHKSSLPSIISHRTDFRPACVVLAATLHPPIQVYGSHSPRQIQGVRIVQDGTGSGDGQRGRAGTHGPLCCSSEVGDDPLGTFSASAESF